MMILFRIKFPTSGTLPQWSRIFLFSKLRFKFKPSPLQLLDVALQIFRNKKPFLSLMMIVQNKIFLLSRVKTTSQPGQMFFSGQHFRAIGHHAVQQMRSPNFVFFQQVDSTFSNYFLSQLFIISNVLCLLQVLS